jgi:hypothetical protein
MQGISFSASSLQDFLDCERRYQLRYVLEAAWPATDVSVTDEQEEHVRLGRDLHRLIQQHLTGIPEESLSACVHDLRLEQWWRAYLRSGPDLTGLRVIPEVTLSTSLAGHRLTARYDALAFPGDSTSECARVLIFDWKTYGGRPSRDWLAGRIQSRIYPLVLARAGASLNAGLPVDPKQIEMQYWVAGDPTRTERFVYGGVMHEADDRYLRDLVGRVCRRSQGAAPWALTAECRLCRHCVYRSLCGRGTEPRSASEDSGGDGLTYQVLPADLEQPSVWCQVEETAC